MINQTTMPKTIIYGTRREPAADVAKTRTIDFVLSTYTRDSHGTVLNQDGWSLDRYRKNPVVAYQHTLSGGFCMDPNPDYIIGKSVSIGLEGEGREKCLVASVQFEPAEINPLAEKIFQKVLFGSLSRCSVGFIEVGRGKYGEGRGQRCFQGDILLCGTGTHRVVYCQRAFQSGYREKGCLAAPGKRGGVRGFDVCLPGAWRISSPERA